MVLVVKINTCSSVNWYSEVWKINNDVNSYPEVQKKVVAWFDILKYKK